MLRPARRTLPILLVTATAALLLAPAGAGAVARRSGLETTAAPTRQGLDPGELRRLLEPIVAAGAPGAAVRVRDRHRVTQAASGLADLRTGRLMRPGLTSGPAA